MKRTKLASRKLPIYTKGEEIMNMITHIVGGGFGVLVLVLCVLRSALNKNIPGLAGSAIYGVSMVALYCVSSIYHGLRSETPKKVMQIIDHCTIYFLIAGTYTPVLLSGFLPVYPIIGWSLLLLEWGVCILATTLTAIDLKKYNLFSMICYIGMGWCIIFFIPQAIAVMTAAGFYLLLAGGIAYTIGAVLYGIGVKKHWMHSVFHIFVVMGSFLQFLAVYLYIL